MQIYHAFSRACAECRTDFAALRLRSHLFSRRVPDAADFRAVSSSLPVPTDSSPPAIAAAKDRRAQMRERAGKQSPGCRRTRQTEVCANTVILVPWCRHHFPQSAQNRRRVHVIAPSRERRPITRR